MDGLPSALSFVPLVAVPVALCATILALLVAVRSRNAFKPSYRVGFEIEQERPAAVSRRVRDRPTDAVFLLVDETDDPQVVHLPFWIKNVSMRKISDITIDIFYPEQFHATNSYSLSNIDDILAYFPDRLNNSSYAKEFINKRRSSHSNGGLAHVQYVIGTLTPGQSVGFFEPLLVPRDRTQAFHDPRYGNSAFGHALAALEAKDHWKAVCRLRIDIFADLLKPKTLWSNVCVAQDRSELEQWPATREYVQAMWFGSYPAGNAYWKNPFFRPLRPTRPVSIETPVVVMELRTEFKASEPKDGQVAVLTERNPLQAERGHATLHLPGYDIYALPKSISATSEALESIGYTEARIIRSSKQ